ncbi:hypothetical protein [Pseudooceanicola aestuarii]|uniref:hypothetical protein n=1 Tax=Pseudooceanicola aestuarii TaxID=2697319 RepID=UPI0013D12C44|nr:hypothetical protein [Pseudooceanicola aestuarii]
MALSDRSYTRFVNWAKILFLVASLSILSTVFLTSRGRDTSNHLPYTTFDLRESARTERATRPSFAGVTDSDDRIAFTAETALPVGDGQMLADVVDARIDLASGGTIAFTAANGTVASSADRAELEGDVIITSSAGYVVRTERLISSMKRVEATAPGAISGEGPPGTFTAGAMHLTSDPETGAAEFVFTKGVKLLYDPGTAED